MKAVFFPLPFHQNSMSKVRVFIVEDDVIHASRLEMYLDEMGYGLAGTASNAGEALNMIAATKPDLLLVDIHLEGDRDGIQLIEKLYQKRVVPAIFITSFADKATIDRAKVTHPYAYIVKPYDQATLQAAIELAVYKFSTPPTMTQATVHDYKGWEEDKMVNDTMFIKDKGRLIKLNTNDIAYIEAQDKYCLIYLSRERVDVRIPLKKLAEILEKQSFQRVHRSFIINKTVISQIDVANNEVQVGGYTVPIGRAYRASFLDSFSE